MQNNNMTPPNNFLRHLIATVVTILFIVMILCLIYFPWLIVSLVIILMTITVYLFTYYIISFYIHPISKEKEELKEIIYSIEKKIEFNNNIERRGKEGENEK